MTIRKNSARLKARLLTSASTGVVVLNLAAPVVAQSTIELDLLDHTPTRLVTATSLIDNLQTNEATAVDATTDVSGGSLTIGISLTGSGATNDSIDGSYSLNDNSVSVEAYSNSATNLISASTTPAFSDSSLVSNLQNNFTRTQATASGASIELYIEALDSGGATFVRTLDGGIAELSGNKIGATATANTSTSTINIADAVSVTGAGNLATVTLQSEDLAADPGTVTDALVTADLSVVNAQINDGDRAAGPLVEVYGNNSGSLILADIEAVSGATVILSDNVVSAAARGSDATNTIETGENAATIDASMAVANLQANEDVRVYAITEEAFVGIRTDSSVSGSTIGSSLTIDNTTVMASAYGLNTEQTLTVDANAVNADNSTAAKIYSANGAGFSGDALTVDAMAALSSVQLSVNTDVIAENSDNRVDMRVVVSGSGQLTDANTLTLSGTTFDAMAVDNRAVSSASLSGNEVGTGVGVVSSQYSSSGSSATAVSDGNDVAIIVNGSGAVDSTITLEQSLDRALAISNSASTILTVAANDIVVESEIRDSGSIYYSDTRRKDNGAADVTGSFIALNDQLSFANITATVSGATSTIKLLGSDTQRSDVSLTGNDVLAAAISSDASNRISLSVNDVSVSGGTTGSGFATVAAAMNQQQWNDGTASAQAISTTNVVTTQDVWNSTVSTDGNSIEALAIGNRSTANTVTVEATNIDTNYQGPANPLLVTSGDERANASILAVSIQEVSGATINAYLTDTLNSGSISSEISTNLGEDVGTATITADLNVLRATATGNSAMNGASLIADATSATSVGVLNEQSVADTGLNVVIGVAGVEDVSYGPISLTGTTVNDTGGGGAGTGVFTTNVSSLTAEQLAYVISIRSGDADYTYDAGTGVMTFNATNGTTNPTYVAGTIPGSAQEGGVFVAIDETIASSTITVQGNLTEGRSSVNTATNVLSVQGNSVLDGGTDIAEARSGSGFASNMLHSAQYANFADASVDVAGAFSIDTQTDQSVSGSTLTVSDNTQLAAATINTVTSTLTVDGNEVSSPASIGNRQSLFTSSADASSNLWVFAPASVDGSSVSLANNLSQAQSRVNVATNTLSVSGNDITGSGSAAEVVLGDSAQATFALFNGQTGEGSVLADSSIRLFNEHETDGTTSGAVNSSIAYTGNVSLAEATMNRSTNTMTVDGANVSATGVLSIDVRSDSSVSATASADIDLTLTNSTLSGAVIDGSNVAIDSNQTTAVATANQSANTINVSATNINGNSSSASLDSTANGLATFVIGTDMFTTQSVDATATDVLYTLNMNDVAATGDGALNSTLTVNGNVTTAQALGNRSSNVLNAVASNSTEASFGIVQSLTNNAAITATVTNLTAGVYGEGVDTSSNSSISVSNNGSFANAIANNTTNSLVLNASNVSSTSGPAVSSGNLDAMAGIVNATSNTADVTATSSNVAYGVALNASDEALTSTTVDVSGNTISSQAIANAGYNSLDITTMAADTGSYGLASMQVNSGQVNAYVTNASIGIRTTGTLSGSMTSAADNAIGAVAIGNTITNVVLR